MNNKLTIGQMAKLNNVSGRALRIYHKMGLLIPEYIDEVTSYRYYSPHQSKKLNIILQMKSVGIPLKQVAYIIDNKDLAMFEAILLKQTDNIENQVSALQLKENSLRKMLDTCKNFLNPPTLNNIFVEYQPERKTYYFNVPPFNYIKDIESNNDWWGKNLEIIRAKIYDIGMPITYFSNIGCIIKQDNLSKNQLICDGAFILSTEKLEYANIPVYTIKSGTYVCMYDKWPSGNTSAEASGINKLFSFIMDRKFSVCGDYIAEVIAESSIFDKDQHLSLVKMQIPVTI